MTYEDFKNAIFEHFRSIVATDTKVSLNQVIKNNGLLLDSLTILPPNQLIAPSIYLNDFYQNYLQGESLESIYGKILQIYEDNKFPHTKEISHLLDFNQVKSMIAYRLINYQANKQLLCDIPHLAYLDLAVVFYLLIDDAEFGEATALIHNEHLTMWDIDTATLYEIATKNTPVLLPFEFTSMNQLITHLLLEELKQNELEEDLDQIHNLLETLSSEEEQMYVLSNHKKYYGASVLLYPNVLEEIATKLQNDFFILPSSIHETIIVPFTDQLEKETLQEMVKEINKTEVDEVDRLSDNVYIYSRDLHEIQI
jgi:hypothetical protein